MGDTIRLDRVKQMSKLSRSLIFTLLALTFTLAPPRSAANSPVDASNPRTSPRRPQPEPQTSYELRCRGGGLRINSTTGRSLQTGETMDNVTVDFTAGTAATGPGRPALNPGQCSWVDRGFRPGEPTQIRIEIVDNGQLKQQLHGSAVDRSPTAAERYPDAHNIPQYLADASHFWSFWVYNSNQGYMQGTAQKFFKALNVRTSTSDKVRPFPGP
jgi:hypothetical protein